MKATVEERVVLVGSHRYITSEGISAQEISGRGTAIYVAIDVLLAGIIMVTDQLRHEAPLTLEQLSRLGIKKIALLSGDRHPEVAFVAEKLGIATYFAELLPEDKVAIIEKLKNESHDGWHTLVFVGDGINDAPVIAVADVGIAMGKLGSDVAIEAADIVLMQDSLSSLPKAIKIARRTNTIVKQNIYLSIGMKAVILTLGVFGVANIWAAVFADVGVTVLAVLNAMRALYYKGNASD
ncbi:MAG: HAD-IC family P-type ATPase, partial [bacterium]|nr:HAD-IC family P-type ATPase [bacterium]